MSDNHVTAARELLDAAASVGDLEIWAPGSHYSYEPAAEALRDAQVGTGRALLAVVEELAALRVVLTDQLDRGPNPEESPDLAALARSLTAHAVATSRLGAAVRDLLTPRETPTDLVELAAAVRDLAAAVRDAQQQPQRRRWWRWNR